MLDKYCKLCSVWNWPSDLILNLWKSSGINTWSVGNNRGNWRVSDWVGERVKGCTRQYGGVLVEYWWSPGSRLQICINIEGENAKVMILKWMEYNLKEACKLGFIFTKASITAIIKSVLYALLEMHNKNYTHYGKSLTCLNLSSLTEL